MSFSLVKNIFLRLEKILCLCSLVTLCLDVGFLYHAKYSVCSPCRRIHFFNDSRKLSLNILSSLFSQVSHLKTHDRYNLAFLVYSLCLLVSFPTFHFFLFLSFISLIFDLIFQFINSLFSSL